MPRPADDVPDLGRALLDAVLAQLRQPRCDRRPDPLDRDGLRDRDEPDRGRVATDPATGIGDPVEDVPAGGRDRGDLARVGSCRVSGRAAGVHRRRGYFARRRKLGISRSSGSIWARWAGAGETTTVVRSAATAAGATPTSPLTPALT